ncbi:putative ACR, YggU family [uncultured archaeon]|nr:putative ACR, YggU family [uncultured archaeon]
MIIHVKVKPNSSKREVESFGGGRYLVYLKSAPENDKANIELINVLSKELGVPPKSLHINFGRTSDEKVIEIKF